MQRRWMTKEDEGANAWEILLDAVDGELVGVLASKVPVLDVVASEDTVDLYSSM